jgi:hypothetical protein
MSRTFPCAACGQPLVADACAVRVRCENCNRLTPVAGASASVLRPRLGNHPILGGCLFLAALLIFSFAWNLTEGQTVEQDWDSAHHTWGPEKVIDDPMMVPRTMLYFVAAAAGACGALFVVPWGRLLAPASAQSHASRAMAVSTTKRPPARTGESR